MLNTAKICPSCHQKKLKVSDRLVPSRTFIWEAYLIIAGFVPIVVMLKLQKMVSFAQDTQTVFLLGALFCLYLFLAYKYFTYMRQYKISTCFACNTHFKGSSLEPFSFKEHYARLYKQRLRDK